jgi:hypothetical protein
VHDRNFFHFEVFSRDGDIFESLAGAAGLELPLEKISIDSGECYPGESVLGELYGQEFTGINGNKYGAGGQPFADFLKEHY